MNLAEFKCEAWLNNWERLATYDIAQSTVEAMTVDEILKLDSEAGERLWRDLRHEKLSYGWIEGSPRLKTAISKLYEGVDTDHILASNGATGANFLAILALIEAGDHVIAQYPTYQQLYDWPESLGAEVDYWKVEEEAGWLPSLEALKEMIRPDTKLICLNNAAQPTGAFMERKFLEEVVKLAKSVGAYILCDEVYMPLDDSLDRVAIASLYEKGISTNSMSKTYSVPGLRLGWLASQDDDFINEIRKLRDYTMISTGVLDDALSAFVLEHRDQVLARAKGIIQENLTILKSWVDQESNVSLQAPPEVSLSFVKLETIPPEETEAFAISLLKEKGVLIIPGNRFDMPAYARIGYACEREVLEKGLALLSEHLREYKK
ncbi:aminotransferase [Lactococcus termiticola]|uniref:Aminotransferase n=1 Tax=Lactococcus termiticola TaxID=2169526 RepID=A0A2R5HHP2_9LACT|nr:aminotransferase [Lactococcus termiticola]GBG97534.1 aminotransferase [Lactococcus termiticola]